MDSQYVEYMQRDLGKGRRFLDKNSAVSQFVTLCAFNGLDTLNVHIKNKEHFGLNRYYFEGINPS